MNRRYFNQIIGAGTLGYALPLTACQGSKSTPTNKLPKESMKTFFKLSLAQWSLHKEVFAGVDPYTFASRAKGFGFEGLEYVSHLYKDKYKGESNQLAGIKRVAARLKSEAQNNGMDNVLIMIDGEGDLGIKNERERLANVTNHHKWVDVAHELGCSAIRINLFSEGTREEQVDQAADSMSRLSDYAKDLGINVLVENHGGNSSDPEWVVEVMQKCNRSNAGTLPDFGNWCVRWKDGKQWQRPCEYEYPDPYKAVEMMMPYAKAVSAKSYNFDTDGNETKIDYLKMMQIVYDAGYRGYVGVEYEGDTPDQGIIDTKNLLLKCAKTIQGHDK